MTDRETLLHQINAYRERHGVSQTRFGRDALNDGHFVKRLRTGGNVTLRTVERVRAFMAKQDRAATPALAEPQRVAA